MYKQAKTINKDFLLGRTIGGINTELKGHWLAYILTGIKNAKVADIGSSIKNKSRKDYDQNACVWECGNIAIKFYKKYNAMKNFSVRAPIYSL